MAFGSGDIKWKLGDSKYCRNWKLRIEVESGNWGKGYTTKIGVFARGQILGISPNGLQAGHCDAPG